MSADEARPAGGIETGAMASDIPTTDELQNLVDKLVAEHKVPGASAAVRAGDHVATGAAGVLNLNTGVEVTPDSIFQIGSNTKVFNATLIMQLVDEGKVDLSEPAVTYLPEFTLKDKKAVKEITVRHLLTHTSGIDGGDYIEDFGRGDDAVERYVASLANVGMVHPIGKFWSYCNAATVVAGRIIEVLTGMPWHKALKARLIDPLGLTHTVATPEEAILFRASAGHMPNPANDDATEVFPVWMLPFATGPAGATITMTASDLTAFGRFHLDLGLAADGTRVLSEASALAMREVQFPELSPSMGQPGGGGQGIGWLVTEQGGVKVLAHGGGTFGQSSQFMVLPDHGVSLAVLTNGPGAQGVINGVVQDVLGRVGGAEFAELLAKQAAAAAESADGPTLPEPPPDLDLSKYEGVYDRMNLKTTVKLVDGVLVSSSELSGFVAQMPTPKPNTLRPVDAETFIVLTDEGKPGGQAKFAEFDGEGRPEFLIIGRVARRIA